MVSLLILTHDETILMVAGFYLLRRLSGRSSCSSADVRRVVLRLEQRTTTTRCLPSLKRSLSSRNSSRLINRCRAKTLRSTNSLSTQASPYNHNTLDYISINRPPRELTLLLLLARTLPQRSTRSSQSARRTQDLMIRAHTRRRRSFLLTANLSSSSSSIKDNISRDITSRQGMSCLGLRDNSIMRLPHRLLREDVRRKEGMVSI